LPELDPEPQGDGDHRFARSSMEIKQKFSLEPVKANEHLRESAEINEHVRKSIDISDWH
jgi:hypothetical protein